MTKQELNNKAKDLFTKYTNETLFYCIDDGNFWFSKDKGSALTYSKKLSKELFTIEKEDIKEQEIKPKKTVKSRKRKSK